MNKSKIVVCLKLVCLFCVFLKVECEVFVDGVLIVNMDVDMMVFFCGDVLDYVFFILEGNVVVEFMLN